MSLFLHFFSFFRLIEDSTNDRDKTNEGNNRRYLDVTGAEDVWIKYGFSRCSTTHKDKAENNNGYTYSQQNKSWSYQKLNFFCPYSIFEEFRGLRLRS